MTDDAEISLNLIPAEVFNRMLGDPIDVEETFIYSYFHSFLFIVCPVSLSNEHVRIKAHAHTETHRTYKSNSARTTAAEEKKKINEQTINAVASRWVSQTTLGGFYKYIFPRG